MQTILDAIDIPIDLPCKLLVAIVCGALLGWNREAKGRAAGLRTQTLVCLGSCVFTMAAFHIVERDPDVGFDPIRVVAAIVGGIGFLGAGSIIHFGQSVRGVTTAATVWISGAIGIVCGIGWFSMAAITVILTIATLVGLDKLSERLEKPSGDHAESPQASRDESNQAAED